MASLNKVLIIGNLGADPEVRFTPGGKAVCNMTVASNERWTDKDGKTQERAEWHRIVVWDKQAENCGKYLAKGRPVYIEGRIATRKYKDKDGADRYITEIIANNVQFLGAPPKSETSGDTGPRGEDPPSNWAGEDGGGMPDHMPF